MDMDFHIFGGYFFWFSLLWFDASIHSGGHEKMLCQNE